MFKIFIKFSLYCLILLLFIDYNVKYTSADNLNSDNKIAEISSKNKIISPKEEQVKQEELQKKLSEETEESVAIIPSDENKDKIVDQIPFLKDFLWQKKAPYNHYVSFAFSALDLRDNRYPFFYFNIQYGQYYSIFRIPGRLSFNLGGFGGRTKFGDKYVQVPKEYGGIFSLYLGMLYEFIFTFKYFYISTGVGMYIRNNKDDKINSYFLFGPKIAIGTTIKKRIDLEVVYKHFSNGHLALPNRGINLLGLQIGFKF